MQITILKKFGHLRIELEKNAQMKKVMIFLKIKCYLILTLLELRFRFRFGSDPNAKSQTKMDSADPGWETQDPFRTADFGSRRV